MTSDVGEWHSAALDALRRRVGYWSMNGPIAGAP